MLNNKNKTINNNSSSIIYDPDPLFDSSIDNISQILLRAINRKNKDKEKEKQEYNNNNNTSRTGLLEEPNI